MKTPILLLALFAFTLGARAELTEEQRKIPLEAASPDPKLAKIVLIAGSISNKAGQHEYFAGALSIADFAILGWVWRHPRHKVELADFAHVQRWYRTMMARPGVTRGFAVPLRRP